MKKRNYFILLLVIILIGMVVFQLASKQSNQDIQYANHLDMLAKYALPNCSWLETNHIYIQYATYLARKNLAHSIHEKSD